MRSAGTRLARVLLVAAGLAGAPGCDAGVDESIRMLRSSRVEERVRGARRLGRLHARRGRAALRRAALDPSPDVRRVAVGSLGMLRDRRAIDSVARALGDGDYEVRLAAARALGAIGSNAARDALLPVLEDPSLPVRTAGALSLERLGVGRPAQVVWRTRERRRRLLDQLETGAVPLRRQAALLLAEAAEGDPPIGPALLVRLDDSDPDVAAAAARAIGWSGVLDPAEASDRSTQPIEKALSHARIDRRVSVLEGAMAALSSAAEVSGRVPSAVEARLLDADVRVRGLAAEAVAVALERGATLADPGVLCPLLGQAVTAPAAARALRASRRRCPLNLLVPHARAGDRAALASAATLSAQEPVLADLVNQRIRTGAVAIEVLERAVEAHLDGLDAAVVARATETLRTAAIARERWLAEQDWTAMEGPSAPLPAPPTSSAAPRDKTLALLELLRRFPPGRGEADDWPFGPPPDASPLRAMVRACGTIGRRGGAASADAAALLEQVVSTVAAEPSARAAALDELAAVRPQALPAGIEEDASPLLRAAAASALEARRDQAGLLGLLADGDDRVRARAALSLGRLGDPASVPALSKTISLYRLPEAAVALGSLRAVGGAPALRAALRGDDVVTGRALRTAAIEALGVLGLDGDVALLASHLDYPDCEVRAAAARALVAHAADAARRIVGAYRQDFCRDVRRVAARVR